MRYLVVFLACSLFFFIASVSIPAQCQDSSSSHSDKGDPVEGTVVSSTRNTLVVRDDNSQYHLFTYDNPSVRPASLVQGARVRVTADAPDNDGTQVATNVAVLNAGGPASQAGDQGAPVPPKVRQTESEIQREARRWHTGVRIGEAFNPELFMFGAQSDIGPIFHPRVMFRPNAEFDFGEVTDLVALNLEAAYRFSSVNRRGNWVPYVGAGPALIFIHQSYQQGRQINFGNFDYETGFNVLAGMQSRRGMFVELKTSLYSGPAPKLRMIFGYNF